MAHRHAKTLSSCPERLPTSPPAWDEATAFVCPSGRRRVGRVGAGSGGVAGAGCSLVSLARANRCPDSTDERGRSCPSKAQEDTLGKASCIAAFSGAYLGPFQFFSGRHDQMCLPTQAGGLLSPLSCPVRVEEQTRRFWF